MTEWQDFKDRYGDPLCCLNCKKNLFAHGVNEIKHCLEAVKTIVKEGKNATRAAIQSEKDYSKDMVNANRSLRKRLNPKYKGKYTTI